MAYWKNGQLVSDRGSCPLGGRSEGAVTEAYERGIRDKDRGWTWPKPYTGNDELESAYDKGRRG